MNEKENIEIWKRKLIELHEKISRLNNDKNALISIRNEAVNQQNSKLSYLLNDIELEEEISILDGWTEFYASNISKYEYKLASLKKEIWQQEFEKIREDVNLTELLEKKKEIKAEVDEKEKWIKEEKTGLKIEEKAAIKVKKPEVRKEAERPKIRVEELFKRLEEKPIIHAEEEKVREDVKKLFGEKATKQFKLKEKAAIIKKPINNLFSKTIRLSGNKPIRYALPILVSLLIISILFISKPEITGYVTVSREKTYEDNLNLVVNESGNYTWTIDKIGDIKSIKATGRVKGNGTARVYIEKDGERYLIFDNKG
ncbi:hypothetical protein J4458_06905 [Candidatus Woesearchaeota archaeon]|nr:hypothetical protein [Candidatus Woesearchaeota archaeon]